MQSKRRVYYGGIAFLAVLVGIGVAQWRFASIAAAQAAAKPQAPVFEVDPFWPKPLPNGWQLGQSIGIGVDGNDHVWVLNRPGSLVATQKSAATNPPSAECCKSAPPVLEFDQQGNLLRSWGGPGQGYEWPESEHGLYVDYQNNVWIAANGPRDRQVLKFSPDGKFLMQIGKRGEPFSSADTQNLGQPTNFFLDRTTNEIYVSDGYKNHRVIVFDAGTGKYKRMWGAYGNKPDDAVQGNYTPGAPPRQQFGASTHCVNIDKDGNVYVCDRYNDRFQIFTKAGKYVKEVFMAPNTMTQGTVCELTFSKDPDQRFIYVSDLSNEHVVIFDRKTTKEVGKFGSGGRMAGQFDAIHSIATDSQGNIFTAETFSGQRVQKFVFKGIR